MSLTSVRIEKVVKHKKKKDNSLLYITVCEGEIDV
jgi:hypothetical protein